MIGMRGIMRAVGVLVLIAIIYPILTLFAPSEIMDMSLVVPPEQIVTEGDLWDGVSAVHPPGAEAVKVMDVIADVVGIPRKFDVYAGTFTKSYGALAGVRDGKPTIIYDQALYEASDGRVTWRWTGVAAHEVGHLLQSHFLSGGSHPAIEADADQFAGFIVARLGGSLTQALAWTHDLNEHESRTHPGRADRVKAITKGWNAGQEQKKRERLLE